VFKHTDAAAAIVAEDYAIIDGDGGGLQISNHFDVAISIAAFEHVHRFPIMLNRVHEALAPEGQLLSLYQPIWPCINGHHIVGIKDAQGANIDFTTRLVPLWGHLLYTPAELYKHLCQHTDEQCAADIVHEVYNSTQINRLFFEDYVAYVENSRFASGRVFPLQQIEVPPDILQALRARHPGRMVFDATTILIRAVK
jgi:trans-aconitate methyltransferase